MIDTRIDSWNFVRVSLKNSTLSSTQMQQEIYTPQWFLEIESLETPKIVKSLENLWEEISPKQLLLWAKKRGVKEDFLLNSMKQMLELGANAKSSPETLKKLDDLVQQCDDITLYGIVRALHIKIHLSDLDNFAREIEEPRKQISKKNSALRAKLVLQNFLDFLQRESAKDDNEEITLTKFEEFVNHACLRLVSTVHPNETERMLILFYIYHKFQAT